MHTHVARASLRRRLVPLAICALVACAAPPAATAPTPAPAVAPTAAPTATPEPSPQPTTPPPTAAPAAALTSDLEAYVAAELQPALEDAYAATGWDETGTYGLQVLPLDPPDAARPLWAVYSKGLAVAPETPHIVAIYTREADAWRELGRVELRAPALTGDALQQVRLDDRRVWLVASGVSGLVGSCCIDVLSFDGAALRSELSIEERNVVSASVAEEDGRPTLVVELDIYNGPEQPKTEETRRYRWDGEALVEVAPAE